MLVIRLAKAAARRLLLLCHASLNRPCLVSVLLQVSASSEVLPPWKQGDYVAESSYTTVSAVTAMSGVTAVSSATQLHVEKHWEQQVTASREVRRM